MTLPGFFNVLQKTMHFLPQKDEIYEMNTPHLFVKIPVSKRFLWNGALKEYFLWNLFVSWRCFLWSWWFYWYFHVFMMDNLYGKTWNIISLLMAISFHSHLPRSELSHFLVYSKSLSSQYFPSWHSNITCWSSSDWHPSRYESIRYHVCEGCMSLHLIEMGAQFEFEYQKPVQQVWAVASKTESVSASLLSPCLLDPPADHETLLLQQLFS